MSATISPAELAEARRSDSTIELIDVRTPAEFQELHVAFARNLPLDRLDPHAVVRQRNGALDKPLYIVCRSGSRGRQACEQFLQAGYQNAINVEGGTLACEQAGLPTVRGTKVISLERQVRIAAGALVLLGVGLAWFVHPALIGISAFVGGGLIFAGVTDKCGMAVLLGRMPWNQCGAQS